MACGATTRITSVENCALSAMTETLQTISSGMTTSDGPPNTNGVSNAHVPLTAMATITSRTCPTRSATSPPTTQPMAPAANTTNDSTPTQPADDSVVWPRATALAARKDGSQIQHAYNSSMCPAYPPSTRL